MKNGSEKTAESKEARARRLNRERQARWRARNLARALEQERAKNRRFAERHPQRVRLNQRAQRLQRKLKNMVCEKCPARPTPIDQTQLAFVDAAEDVRRDVFERIAKTPALSVATDMDGKS